MSYVDLCSGSGAIYVTLLLEFGDRISYSAGVDVSLRAGQNVLENLFELGVKGNPKVYLSNWESFLNQKNQWEVITMNPPYVASEELTLNFQYDPKSSLVATEQGLTHYKKLLDYLKKNTYWKLVVLECSEFHENFWKEIETFNPNWVVKRYKDYLGKFRVVSIVRK